MSRLCAVALLFAALLPSVAAAQNGITYSEDFQTYTARARVAGWGDSYAGQGAAHRRAVSTPAGSLYGAMTDPTAATNIAYGFHAAAVDIAGGSFSTLTPFKFAGTLEYSGRLFRSSSDSAGGLAFFSSSPEKDSFYLVAVSAGSGSTMRLEASGGRPLGGAVDSGIAIEANIWYRFRIVVDATGAATSIRARFWRDGAAEPGADSIDASDSAASRPRAGRIGVWTGGSGGALVDDLFARSSIGSSADTQPPVIAFLESGIALDPAKPISFARPVAITIVVTDQSAVFYTSTLDGQPYTSGDLISSGAHVLRVQAVDASGNESSARLDFAITLPSGTVSVSITSPAPNDVLGAARALVRGAVENATALVVNGVPGEINSAGTSFTAEVPLLEGANVVSAVATGPGGTASASVNVIVDTRGPELTISAPAEGACLDGSAIEIRGAAADRALKGVVIVPPAGSPVDAVVQPDGTWRAVVPVSDEGAYAFSVQAADVLGHVSALPLHVRVDRTDPAIVVTESGAPFVAAFFGRPVVPFVRTSDPNASVTATLDGAPYSTGTSIGAEGAHELRAAARDCAGHTAEAVVRFTIDVTPPQILSITPPSGGTFAGDPPISGTASADAVTIMAAPSGRSYPVEKGVFVLSGLPLAEGVNHLVLHVADAAGNLTEREHTAILKSTTPSVSILEDGSAIPDGALFNRSVAPTIESSDATATIAATLNGSSYAPGAPIGSDGTYTLEATATDSVGHTAQASVRFTIDQTPPMVTIVAPSDGDTLDVESADVRGTVSGDPVSLLLNGVAVAFANGAFTSTVPMDRGPNTISAVVRDLAGNAAATHVTVTRPSGLSGILLTAPPDGMITNRATTLVAGQVLTPSAVPRVTIGGIEVPIDARGVFRRADVPVAEGDNTITAMLSDGSVAHNSVTVHVIGDRTPPRVRILESGQSLSDGSRFADRALITVDASDRGAAIVPSVEVDGAPAAVPLTISSPGGHVITATARDVAGNETRAERTLFIGANGASGCALDQFDPPTGSVVTSPSVTITGQCGGAAGVKVNGIAAYVASGGFCATVELSQEGDNAIAAVCTDGAGNPTGTPASLTLRRVTGQPSISITAPEEGSQTSAETATVSGTLSGAASVEVNGIAAAMTAGSFTATGVRLTGGINTIVARARNAAGRVASASRRIVYLKDAPALTITSPLSDLTTGAARIDVSGTWSNVDPSTIAAAGVAAQPVTWSDTSGVFVIRDVPLTNGGQTLTVTARDALGRSASATVAVALTPGWPSISISEPSDAALFAASATTIIVRGSFVAAPGSSVDVSGVPATIDTSSSTFTASVAFSGAPGGVTPIIARVTEPGGAASVDTVRVIRVAAAPVIVEAFPTADAVEMEPGAMPMVLFSTPMDRASVASAFRFETSAGVPVTGVVRLDRDVLTFAPAALLTSGGKYTIRIGTGARDLAGNTLAAEYSSAFTVAGTAPDVAPSIAPIDAVACAQQREIRGTAPAGSRVRLDFGPLTLTSTSSTTGAFTFQLPLSGRSGCQVARVRTVGSDGSLSPAAEVRFQVDCAGLQVIAASYDRGANRLSISFSREVRSSSVTVAPNGSIQLQLADGRIVGGTATTQNPATTIVVTPAEDLSKKSFVLLVSTAIEDLAGRKLAIAFSQSFTLDDESAPPAHQGTGFISGEVFDGDTGRPLSGATIAIDSTSTITDARGRYGAQVAEGPHTIAASASGFLTVWRQVIVAAGASVIPIDIRLARQGTAATVGAGDFVIRHGGSAGLPAAELRIPAGGVPAATAVALTSTTPQSLPGLLPLGWSPLACASIQSAGAGFAGAQLTFTVPLQEITAAAQSLFAVQYRPDRDDWVVISAAPNVGSDGRVAIPLPGPAAIALVYADRAPGLTLPPPAFMGAALQAAADACAAAACPALTAKSFVLSPQIVLPTGSSIATLTVDGSLPAVFPSGTAVQAYVDEELRLADGSRIADPPFSVDLLLYRKLDGTVAIAQFQLAPSTRAAQIILQAGFDHIRILPYPGRLDRGTLIGPEGGHVPGDGSVAVDIPTGAFPEPLRATTSSITDFGPFGAIAGFHIVAGFALTLQRAGSSSSAELIEPARVTFSGINSPAQHVVVEILDDTPFGRLFRLAAETVALPDGRLTTKGIDRARLPVEGIVHEGRYLLLAADAPMAFATGSVRVPAGAYVADARVTAGGIGVSDLTRPGGLFSLPVLARPAAPFKLVPRSRTTGDGAPYTHPTAPDVGEAVHVGDVLLTSQPPAITSVTPADGAVDVALGTFVKATFAPAIDPQSVDAASITVVDRDSGAQVAGATAAEGTTAIVWTLAPGVRFLPNRTYVIAIAPTVRGTTGSPFGRTVVTRFSTIAQLTSVEVHPERIRIAVPDATGHSRVTGDPGALPAAWNALVIRRSRDFSNRPQATAATDGSFAIDIAETVAISDRLDLQVVNAAGSVAAVIPLTPFVRSDGSGFIAPPGHAVRFTTPDGWIAVSVPAGAFDVPTDISVTSATAEAFSSVPNVSTELRLGPTVRLEFSGVAKDRLDIELAAPADAASTPYFLGRLGASVRGPRVEIVDTLRLDNGRLVSSAATGTSAMRRLQPAVNQAFADQQGVKNALIGAVAAGTYAAVAFPNPVAWLVVDVAVVGQSFDIFSTSSDALFVSGFALVEKHGRALMPVPAGKPFQLVGYDASTGLEAFRIDRAGVPPLDPLNAIATPVTTAGDLGPYPTFVSPGRLELVTAPPDDATLTSIAGITITQTKGEAFVSGAAPQLPVGTLVRVVNLTNASSGSSDKLSVGGQVAVAASPGDRLVVAVASTDVDPEQAVEIVFSGPLDFGTAKDVDAFFHGNGWIRVLAGDDPKDLFDVTQQATFSSDAQRRRIALDLPLQRGKWYRLILSGAISGPPVGVLAGLKMGQRFDGATYVPAAPKPIVFEFRTRAPAGPIGQMTLPNGQGGIRDMALSGNVALLATTAGGLQAFDISDPAGISGSTVPLNRAAGEYWSVEVDRHGRVFAAGTTGTFGVVRSFRIEDFVEGAAEVKEVGGANVSWRPGANFQMPVGSETLLGDRPEALPRKLQVLVQDDEQPLTGAKLLMMPHNVVKTWNGGLLQMVDVSVSVPADLQYWKQRITIENRTLGGRWSADVARGQSGFIRGVIVAEADDVVVARNTITYGVLSLYGYGIGVFDLNAIESNDEAVGAAGYVAISERVLLTAAAGEPRKDMVYPAPVFCDGAVDPKNTPCVCDPTQAAPAGVACEIRDLTFSPDALIFPSPKSGDFTVFAVDQIRGVLDINIAPPRKEPGPPPVVTNAIAAPGGGLSLSQPYRVGVRLDYFLHPRLRTLHDLYAAKNGQNLGPLVRFASIAPYVRGGRNYALVAANGFGLLVIDTTTALIDESLADVIWIPAGATSVRTIPSSDLAAVVDGAGRVLLVDLKRIDERESVAFTPTRVGKDHTCLSAACAGELFPTAKKCLQSKTPPLPKNATWLEVGVDDPRIVWKSEPNLVSGTLPPIVDPDTGILLTGDMNGARVNTVAAVDPRVAFSIRTEQGPRYVSSIVPLGVAPNVATTAGQSPYAAFRVEVALPGAIAESLASPNNELRLALESERLAGAPAEQTPNLLPLAHLRRTTRAGVADARAGESDGFVMQRLLPYDAKDPQLSGLRYQRGFNWFVSPPVVAIADPRASERYVWGKNVDPASEGCSPCRRRPDLTGLKAPAVFEMLTRGRFIAARPEAGSFNGTKYGYLAGRLEARVATVMADSVRPLDSGVAAQNPPVAGGALLETTYLHSGEVETAATDIDSGGRNGFNVVIGRVYRSRSIGAGPLGSGWDSPMFKRLRPMPNGDVEFRDGSGSIWTFRAAPLAYIAPPGLFVALARAARGWTLRDQRNRLSLFDDLGRLTRETDEYFDTGSGNAIDFLYDASGRLSTIVDPVGRRTTLQYYDTAPVEGLLRSVRDWRTPARVVDYIYDAKGRLMEVLLPEVLNTDNVRPTVHYAYADATLYSDRLELENNLASITEPHEVATGGKPRVEFQYAESYPDRDRVKFQTWATGDHAEFTYMLGPQPPGGTTVGVAQATVTDALRQERRYAIAGLGANAHVTSLVEAAIPTAKTPFGELPKNPTAGIVETVPLDRQWTFACDANGLQTEVKLTGVLASQSGYVAAANAPGLLPSSSTTEDSSGQQAITHSFEYQDGAFLKSVSAGNLLVHTPEPTRTNMKSAQPLVALNDSIESTTHYDAAGRISGSSSKRTAATVNASDTSYTYKADDSPQLYERGEVATVNEGGLFTAYGYTATTTAIAQPRNINTTISFDAWRRPVNVTTTGPELTTDESTFYDASGRVAWREEKKGSEVVRTTFEYDPMGRQKSVTRDKAVVNDILSSVTTSFTYDLGKRAAQTVLPTGGIITRELDGVGRVAREVTATGGTPIENRYAYDQAGNRVLATDMKSVTASAFDVHGREVATLNADGTTTTRTFDDWGRALDVKSTSATGTKFEQASFDFTAAGRLRSTDSQVDSGVSRHAEFAWDGAGRTVGTSVGNRAASRSYDNSGRLLSSAAGEGSAKSVSSTYVENTYSAMTGWLPQHVDRKEKSGPAQAIDREYDTTANVTRETVGKSLEWESHFDETGNLVSYKPPSRPPSQYEYDGRGSLLKETMPTGAENNYHYDVAGSLAKYIDPSKPASEKTSVENDLLGRPLKRVYPDASTEVFSYDGSRLAGYTDREGRTQLFTYNEKGQLTRIDGQGGLQFDQLDYDEAGRLVAWTNRDSKLTWEDFNLDGRPRRTTLTVYRGGTAFAGSQVVAEFRQQHVWNEHGERVEWTMPRPATFATSLPWTDRVRESHDAMGNTVAIDRMLFGSTVVSPLLSASYRNAGRPDIRAVTSACGSSPCAPASIIRKYGYDNATGMVMEMNVTSRSIVVAGSRITALSGTQIAEVELAGISNGARTSSWSYDDRSRLSTTSVGRTSEQVLSPADFRQSFVRTPRFDAATRTTLEKAKVDVGRIDAPSQSASELSGHKIDKLTVNGADTPFAYNGAERTSDGAFAYEWDEKGRLVRATESAGKPPKLVVMRVAYTYDGNDRMITRRVEAARTSSTPLVWQLATADILTDGIPADAIFVWDPVSDGIAAVYDASTLTLSRQVIHGGNDYDDPIEVTLTEPANPTRINRLYPVYDEAAAGHLQAVLNASGEIVSRKIFGDAYGDEAFSIAGAAIDRVQINVSKNPSGAIANVDVTIRSTEELLPSSVAAGVRLAARDANGKTLQSASVAPVLSDPFTAKFTLSSAEWTTFVSGATSISIAATPALRASAWGGSVPVLPAPPWATATLPVSSTDYPVEVRESVSNLTTRIAAIPSSSTSTITLYEITDLALLGSPDPLADPSRFLVPSPFQALPFVDTVTRLTQVRARWLDHRTGTFLSPDPMGYRDSANLYAYCGGDPVNMRDPTGEITIIVHGTGARTAAWWSNGSFAKAVDAQVGDVWKLASAGGKSVSAVPELVSRFGPQGKFLWSGENSQRGRTEGAQRLADYINTIRRLYPRETIRVVTHSHGGNVAAASTNADLVTSPAAIDQLVVIAKPYFSAEPTVFKALRRRQTFYDPDPTRVRGPILSISSLEDDIQQAAAERGAFDRTPIGYGPIQSTRTMQSSALAGKFIDAEVKTAVGWYDAHGVLHDTPMGTAIGIYLRTGGASAANWARARALAGVPKVITNDKDKGD